MDDALRLADSDDAEQRKVRDELRRGWQDARFDVRYLGMGALADRDPKEPWFIAAAMVDRAAPPARVLQAQLLRGADNPPVFPSPRGAPRQYLVLEVTPIFARVDWDLLHLRGADVFLNGGGTDA